MKSKCICLFMSILRILLKQQLKRHAVPIATLLLGGFTLGLWLILNRKSD